MKDECVVKSKIDAYLEEETENDKEGFDVLAWWKSKTEKISYTISNGSGLPCNSSKHGVIRVCFQLWKRILETIETH